MITIIVLNGNILVFTKPGMHEKEVDGMEQYRPGSGLRYSKLTTSLVNVLLRFQMLISEICQYFLLKSEMLLHCKSFSHFFNKKYQCIWL